MPVTRFRLVSTTWIPWEWVADGAEQVGTSRDELVSGVDKPTAQTTGILTDVEELTEFGTGSTIILGTGTYENRIFLGRVTFSGTSGEVIFKNCLFAGNDPNGGSPGNVVNNTASSSTSRPMVHLLDCTIDPGYWVTHKSRSNIFQEVNGVFGGNFNIQRCEIKNVCDGVGIHGAYTSEVTIELSWIHKGNYSTGPANTGQSDQRLHSDAIQFHTGKNVTIRGNIIGGMRDMVGYQTTFANAYNSGDDYENSCILIKQEVNDSLPNRLENILIEQNWIYGGMSSVNLAHNSASATDFATTIVRNNRFATRLAGWGYTRRMDGQIATSNTNGGLGWYILRSASSSATFTGNVYEDTGLPVPLSNG